MDSLNALVVKVYTDVLLRYPSENEIKYQVDKLRKGMDQNELKINLYNCDEFRRIFSHIISANKNYFTYSIRCKYINVGLPRTGTQSLDYLVENQLKLKAGHLLPHDETSISLFIQNKDSFLHRCLYDYDFLSDIPLFYPKIIETILDRYKNIKLIYTTRSKISWINSINKNIPHEITRNLILHNFAESSLSDVYDHHSKLMLKYGITQFNIEKPDNNILSNFFEKDVIFPKFDNIVSGVKNSSIDVFYKHKNDLKLPSDIH